MLSSDQIRQQFIDFFAKKHGHTYVPSSPAVPVDDPTLLFTNAGMNQFKDVFLGLGTRPYNRAANTQKCIRAGGKHNDLEDVGKDTYHHTFFEMLGNWSFGNYFKKEAIGWAWELLTEVWGLEKDRLHATCFGGDSRDGLEADQESADLWKSMTDIRHDHIHFCSRKDNFWEMGETGPCGPCTEIHIDLTPDKSGKKLVNAGTPQAIEIWNLVFIQFNRDTSGKLSPLPAKHVDTGMGFERLCAVLQGRDGGYRKGNYDTDVFLPLFDEIQKLTGARPYSGDPATSLKDPIDTAYRVIADHARCLTFAITDGAEPSNDGRGYVLRRILRRAARYGRQNLDTSGPFLHKLVPMIASRMGHVFPELKSNPQRVADILHAEEESFGRTLDRGIELFDKAAADSKTILAAEPAFRLYDTFGFPLDLTQIMAAERGLKVDVDGFNRLMEEARHRSRAGQGGGSELETLVERVQRGDLPATRFTGYTEMMADEVRMADLLVRTENGYQSADSIAVEDEAAIVTDTTPFYAESGGQVGDRGVLHSRRGAVFRIRDTQKFGEVYFHLGRLEDGGLGAGKPALAKDDALLLELDQPRRRRIMAHHTATHLANWALREVLGDHIQQRGSLVDDEKTRFDFSHPKALSPEEIERVTALVNERIAEDLEVFVEFAPQEKALEIHGLRAVFGEKYPPQVRVVSIGVPVKKLLKKPQNTDWRQFSVEFCGGTHLGRTSEAGSIAILSEEAVGKGIRRLTAVAGDQAKRAREHAQTLSKRIEALNDVPPESLAQDLASISEALSCISLPISDRAALRVEIEKLQKKLKDHQKQADKSAESDVVDAARKIAESAGSEPFIVTAVEGADAGSLRKAMDVIRSKCPEAAMMLAATDDEKISFLAAVPQAMIDRGLKAGDWVREVAKVAGGGGGGRPDMAQAGGKNPSKLGEALERGRQFAQQALQAGSKA